jgi:predicted branched-subunit amino acid permease
MMDAPQADNQTITPKYPTVRAAFWGGVLEAGRVPMMIMGASFIGFGSMIHDMDWSIWQALYSTLSTWALPGQIAMAEMAARGAPLMAIILAVGFINARLLPMVASLLPQVRRPGLPGWAYYGVAMLIAATSWVGTMRRLPDLLPEQRFPFLMGYGLLLYCGSPLFTVAGYMLAGNVPHPVTLALVYLNPLYFMVLFLVDLRSRTKIAAIVIGTILGPATFLFTPDWSLIMTGLIGGTAAWALGRSPKLPPNKPISKPTRKPIGEPGATP